MFTSSDQMDGKDAAFGGDIEYPNEPLDAHIFFQQIGKKFDPALGFVSRQGIRDYSTSLRYTWRPNTDMIRSITIGAHPNITTDLKNRILAEDHDITILELATPAKDEISLNYALSRDVLDEPFEIRPGIIVPQGDYSFGQIRSEFRSSEARPVGLNFSYSYGGFYSGTSRNYGVELDLRPSRYLSAGVGYELGKIDLEEGDFDVQVAGANLELTFTPDLSWNTIVQYENFSNEVWLNSRIRWTYRPGSDLFLVVNNGWDFNEWSFKRLSTELAVKIVATFRF